MVIYSQLSIQSSVLRSHDDMLKYIEHEIARGLVREMLKNKLVNVDFQIIDGNHIFTSRVEVKS